MTAGLIGLPEILGLWLHVSPTSARVEVRHAPVAMVVLSHAPVATVTTRDAPVTQITGDSD